MSLETLVIMEIFKGIDIVSFIVGIIGTIISGVIVFVVIHLLKSVFGRYPQKLFKTQFDPNRNYEQEQNGKLLSLRMHKSRTVYGFHFFVESKKLVDDIDRLGIRPQNNKPWYKIWLASYNNKTKDIDLDERDNSPIRIISVKDVNHYPSQNFQGISDDGACGKWLYYKPAIKMQPNSKLIFWIEIEINKAWKGYIDFRLNTNEGRRVAHHPCEIIRIRP
jgi:hypothetical protein